MAGVKGRSGTNKNKDKPWTEALRLVAFRDDDEGKRVGANPPLDIGTQLREKPAT